MDLVALYAHRGHQLGKGVARGFDQPPLMLSKNSDASSDGRQEDAKSGGCGDQGDVRPGRGRGEAGLRLTNRKGITSREDK